MYVLRCPLYLLLTFSYLTTTSFAYNSANSPSYSGSVHCPFCPSETTQHRPSMSLPFNNNNYQEEHTSSSYRGQQLPRLPFSTSQIRDNDQNYGSSDYGTSNTNFRPASGNYRRTDNFMLNNQYQMNSNPHSTVQSMHGSYKSEQPKNYLTTTSFAYNPGNILSYAGSVHKGQQLLHLPFSTDQTSDNDQNYGSSNYGSSNTNTRPSSGSYGGTSNLMSNVLNHMDSIPHSIVKSMKGVKSATSSYLKTEGLFSKDVIFGAATSAYQVEGAWNVDGRGPSIWDEFTHRVPSPIRNNDTGDVASDSYYRYKEDVKLAAQLGLKMYRISISWSRILPTGYSNYINYKGLEYYRNLVREIRKYDMVPAVTIYHFDLPQRLFDDGHHWTNATLIPHFVDYARIVIESLPEVGYWFTINEPKQVCHSGYNSDHFPPAMDSDGLLEYQCSYIILKAHAAVYRMYKKEFPHYSAKMSIIMDCAWIEPFSNSPIDEAAAERQRQFECGLYYNPVFNGDWPEAVKNRIRDRSFAAGLSESRLPQFTRAEIEYVKGTADFLSVNHYYTQLARDVLEAPLNVTSYDADLGVADSFDSSWTVESNGIFVSVPYGVRKVLKWLTLRYGPQQIMITEIGMSDNGTYTNDMDRVDFYGDYFCNILEAVDEGVNLMGIIYWSLIDNFEWPFGYTAHFGLYHIDYNDPQLRRRPKKSATFVQELSRSRKLKCDKPRRNWPGLVKLPSYKRDPSHKHGYFALPHPRLLPNMVDIIDRFNSILD